MCIMANWNTITPLNYVFDERGKMMIVHNSVGQALPQGAPMIEEYTPTIGTVDAGVHERMVRQARLEGMQLMKAVMVGIVGAATAFATAADGIDVQQLLDELETRIKDVDLNTGV